ncbi:MAG: hypothetical protein IPH13_21645 [Planctomycetes bacterium]|nr:hypothetical protein [Planctomycetota bacterium]
MSTTSFHDLIPYFLTTPEEDPTGAIKTFCEALDQCYAQWMHDIRGLPTLMNARTVNTHALVEGQPVFGLGENTGAGKVLSSQGLNKLLLTVPSPPAQDVLNGYGVYWQTGPLAGQYRTVADYQYAPLAVYKFVCVLDSALAAESAIDQQVLLAPPNRVWLPTSASDTDGAYIGYWLRVVPSADMIGADTQYRKITDYVGASRMCVLESPLAHPPGPNAQVSVVSYQVPLQYLAQHLGIYVSSKLSEAQQRQLIASAVDIYKIKGTPRSFQVLLRLLGWAGEVVHLGQSYARPTPLFPPYDLEASSSTALVPLDQHRDILPYKANGWGTNGPKKPSQKQFQVVTETPEYVSGAIPAVSDAQDNPDPLTWLTSLSYILNPTFDAAGVLQTSATTARFPDSDIKLYVAPLKPGPTPTLTDLANLLFDLETVRPIHVEIAALGWLIPVVEPVYVEETVALELRLRVTTVLAIAATPSTTLGFTDELLDTAPAIAESVQLTRPVRWDTSQDRWDGGAADVARWDTSLIGVG